MLLALKQDRRCIHDTNQARQALGAATARQNADHGFRQADLGLGIVVRHDAVMAGHGDLETTAQGQAVDRSCDRLAAGFQLAQRLVQAITLFEQFRLHLVFRQLGHVGRSTAQFGQVRTGTEGRLAGGQDHALDGVVGFDLLGQFHEIVHDVRGDNIHRLAGAVECDEGNAVAVDFKCEVFHQDFSSSDGVSPSCFFFISLSRPAPKATESDMAMATPMAMPIDRLSRATPSATPIAIPTGKPSGNPSVRIDAESFLSCSSLGSCMITPAR